MPIESVDIEQSPSQPVMSGAVGRYSDPQPSIQPEPNPIPYGQQQMGYGDGQPSLGLSTNQTRSLDIPWEAMTNIEKFDWLRQRAFSTEKNLEDQLYTLRRQLVEHSHDAQGRPCKPLTY